MVEGKLKLYDEVKKTAPEVPLQNKWEATNPVRIVRWKPGRFAYSNPKYAVLDYIIEKNIGKPYNQYCQKIY